MKSGQAHAWLFIDLINTHLREFIDSDDSEYAPEHCGPCGALRDYWSTPRGRAEAQAYLNQLGPQDRGWVWAPGGVIDWAEIERRMRGGQDKVPTVTVKKKVYDELIEDQKVMTALQNAGVDDWDGYAVAMEEYREMD